MYTQEIDQLELEQVKKCSGDYVLAVNDAMNVLSGKWKLPIIGTLTYGNKRFKELEREIPKITPRMLSKELKELEVNGIVNREVYDTMPVTIEYSLTDAGLRLCNVLDAMVEWGLQHRKNVMGKA